MTEVVLFTDGAARGNPGPGAYGYVVLSPEGKELATGKATLGHVTNNVAEYKAVIHGLRHCQREGWQRVEVRSDSQLLVRQLSGQYKVKAPGIIPLVEEVKTLCSAMERVKFVHVRREQNKIADALANEALDAVKT